MKESDIADIKQLLADASHEDLTVGLVNKGSHEANAEFIRECLAWQDSTEVYCNITQEYGEDRGKIIAFTGNGPRSKGNAALFMHARTIIKELLYEREELKRQLANLERTTGGVAN